MNKTIDKEYWLKKLSGELPEISLPFIFKTKEKKGKAIGEDQQSLQLEIPPSISAKLKKAAKNSDIALFILFLSGVKVVLNRYAGVDDLVVGTVPPAANGNSGNVIFCRSLVSRHMAVKEFIFQTRQVVLEAINYGEYSLDDFLEVLMVKNDTGFLNIFNTAFIFEPFQKMNGVLSRFDLLLILSANKGQLKLQVRSPSGFLSYQGARGFGRNLIVAVGRMLENPGQELAILDIVSHEEKKLLLHDFNDTAAEYPKNKTIYELFKEQVEKTPNQIALVGVHPTHETHEKNYNMSHLSHMSYNELNEKSNQLAMKLEEKGVKPGTIVGIMVERTVPMITGLLGILEAGAAYLPLDPGYPEARIKYIIEKSSIALLLTRQNLNGKYKSAVSEGKVIDIFAGDLHREPGSQRAAGMAKRVDPTSPAYVIYTSGSTGNPKGVVVNHKNAVNFIMGMTSVIDFLPGKTILALTTISFDIFLLETLLPVTSGLKIVIAVEDEQKDPHLLKDVIGRHQVEMVQTTPTRLQLLLTLQDDLRCLAGVKDLMVGGEVFPSFLFESVKTHFQGKIYNLYGPTETTVWSTIKDLTHVQSHQITIGSPIANTRVYIVDKHTRIQPLGVAGELLIGGDGAAMGYLDNVELTAERFISVLSPYSPHSPHSPYLPDSPIYLTGDLARWLTDGNIEFIGRLDYQLKIRGFRVELGEIENQILTHEAVKETVVTTMETIDDKRLCAYILPRVSHAADTSKWFKTSELRDYLSRSLPGYMIPSFFVLLDQVPLTPNGKVDRKALPAPELETGEDYVAPRNPIEEKLVDIWSSVLEIEPGVIGIDSNFFDLGGHSLKAILILSRIHKAFQVKLSMGQVFKAPVIRKLAAYIKEAVHQDFTAIAPVEKKAYYRLSSAQKRLYILNEMEGLDITYNMPTAMRVEGQPDKNRFQKTLQALIKRHESLRTSFRLRAGKLVQIIQEKVDFQITYHDMNNGGKEEEIVTNFVKPFDLSKAPLLRVGLIRLSPLQHVFIVDIHHIISDGLSMDILAREFVHLYDENTLPALNIQYKDFSEWQNRRFESGEIEKLKIYWLEKLAGEIPSLNMPIDSPRPDYQSFKGNTLSFSFPAEKIEKLNGLAKEKNITLNFLFLSLYFLLLSKYSNQDDIIIGSLVAGRNHPDLEHVMGMFGNFLPIRSKIESNCTFLEFLDSTGKTILEAYENQDYPFEEIIDLLNLPVTLSRNPLFDTMFIFHNEIAPTIHQGIDDLIFTSYPLANRTSKLDFKIDAFVGEEEELNCNLEYSVNLFKKETIKDLIRHFHLLIDEVIENPHREISGIELFTGKEKSTLNEKRKLHVTSSGKAVKMAVSATFTSEPIKDYVIWWGKQFGLEIDAAFAPYNQVFQELLDETGVISSNPGINILLVRFEDWIRDLGLSDQEKCKKLEHDFKQMLKIFKDKPKVAPYFVGIFPAAAHLYFSSMVMNLLEDMYQRWEEAVESLDNVYVMDFTQLDELYAFDDTFDPLTDKEGHLPFSSRFYAAMGAVIARNIRALEQPSFKVIVLDCDNTLWNGICGEDGALGVRVDTPHWELQQFMIQKYNQGFLLALCSKNNETDVWEVFEKNPGMLLKKDYFVSWRIDWKPKSGNIKELANELNLGIDSFILLDDSPVECSEVMTHCPEVLTLQLPQDPGSIPHYLKHVWAFDKIKVTDEDRSRTQMYRAEKKRKDSQTQSQSLTDFLAGLQLKISMNFMKPRQVSRVSQLTLRTNQFNLGTMRRNEDEIIKLQEKPGTLCWVIEVSDRFGDYGLVGVVITKEKKESLFIDTLLLSCRVLGRGVEEALLAGLRKYCRTGQLKLLEANYYPTPKNKPLLEFLQRKWIEKEDHGEYRTFVYPFEERSESVEYADIYYQESFKTELPQETTPPGKEDILLDHIAVAVTDLERAVSIYSALGYTCGDVTYDPLQRSNLVMCRHPQCDSIELVAAADSHSPTNRIIAKNNDIPYHFCYRTKDIRGFLNSLAQRDLSFEIVDDLKPAVLFDYKKVMFLQVEHVGLVELLEDQAADFIVTQQEKVKSNAVRMVVSHPEPSLAFFKLMGYEPVKSINNGKRLEITLAKTGAGKIQLLVPTKKAVKEQEFLNQNGPHLYQLCFDEDAQQKPADNGKEMGINVDYICYRNRKDSKQSSGSRYHWQIKTTDIHQLVHSNQLLPLENYTADMLLGLPTYKVNESITSRKKYDPPRYQLESKLAEIWQKILRMERIGINETFFELGGNSLKAITLISEIHKAFNVELSLKDIFKSKTIKELSQRITNSEENIYSSIELVEKRDYHAVSSAQNRLFILQHMTPESTGYNMPTAVELEGDTTRERLEEVFAKLIRRHESLRTSFEMVEETPVQRVHDDVEFEIEYYDLQVTGAGGRCRWEEEPFGQINAFGEGKINHKKTQKDTKQNINRVSPPGTHHSSFIIHHFIRPFDLSHAPLLRMRFIRIDRRKNILVVDMHHIIADGVSFDILANNFMRLYAGETLPELKIQYKDFSQWMNKEKEQKNLEQQEEYWLKEFAGEIPVLNLPIDYVRPALQSFEGDQVPFEIDGEQYNGIKKMETKGKATLYMVLLTIYNVLLSKLSGQEDIVVGSPTAGRRHPELQPVIGMFVNTLSLRNSSPGEKRFSELLGEIKERTLLALENQDYPFEDLVGKVAVKRDASRNPLFDVAFVLQNMESQEVKISELHLKPYPYERMVAKFDLTMIGVDTGKTLILVFEFCTKLFKRETIEKFKNYFITIVSAVTGNPEGKISGIDIITGEEKNRILYDFNDTGAEYPKDKVIYRLFEEQAARTPDNIALIGQIPGGVAPPAYKEEPFGQDFNAFGDDVSLTYKELNQKSHQLACGLQEKGVVPETIVAIVVERSIEMIVGILGILKAGGAYLPIDPEYPAERIQYMLNDSNTKFLVTTPGLSEKFKKLSIVNSQLLIVNEKPPDRQRPNNTPKEANSINNYQLTINNLQLKGNTLAYIIYTSGSTGQPKGVIVDHASIVNTLYALEQMYPFTPADVYLMKTAYFFDVSLTELFGWFWGNDGGRLVLLEPGGEKEPEKILDVIEKMHITHINFVPSMFDVFLDRLIPDNIKKLSGLKYIFLAGEALPAGLVNRFRDLDRSILLENLYGPTEAAIYASRYSLSDWQGGSDIPIGKPVQNVSLYILDRHDGLLPVGVPGELAIGGLGVARGYLNRQELTAEKFIKTHHSPSPHLPITPLPYSPIYRTGDLVRWQPDGNIEFLGRLDHQVKIRGYRVELGEIENFLRNHHDVKDAVVTGKEKNGTRSLYAYIVPREKLNVLELRKYLSRQLPEYMIPSHFMQIEKIPLTANGKMDRNALDLYGTRLETGTTYQEPRNAIEKKIAETWIEVLKTEKVGIHDNYFELGGTSFDIIRINRKLKDRFQIDIPVVVMFRYTTIHSLAGYLNDEGKGILDRTTAIKKGKKSIKTLRKRKGVINGRSR